MTEVKTADYGTHLIDRTPVKTRGIELTADIATAIAAAARADVFLLTKTLQFCQDAS